MIILRGNDQRSRCELFRDVHIGFIEIVFKIYLPHSNYNKMFPFEYSPFLEALDTMFRFDTSFDYRMTILLETREALFDNNFYLILSNH